MSNKNSPLNKKTKLSLKAILSGTSSSDSTQPKKPKFTARPKKPELSVVNVIEQISQMLRKEIHNIERKKVAGE